MTDPKPNPDSGLVNATPGDVAPRAGNTNALTHGAFRFRDRGLLPAGAEDVGEQLETLLRNYETDLGGAETLSTGQTELLGLLRTVAGMRLLVERDLGARGWKTPRGSVRSSVKLLLTLIEREVALLKLLGLKRTARRVPSIEEYIAAKRKDASASEGGGGR